MTMGGAITRILDGLQRRWRAARFRMQGMELPGSCWIASIEVPRHADAVSLGAGVALDRGITLLITRDTAQKHLLVIGENTYINRHTIIDASCKILIEPECMIGPFCYITDHDHDFSTDGRIALAGLQGSPVRIGRNTWIGAHVTILKGVQIGENSVVGAGSVVTKSIPAGSLAVGNPARVIRTIKAVPAKARTGTDIEEGKEAGNVTGDLHSHT